MNALEREYRDNVERTRVREERRVLVACAIGGAIFIGVCVYTSNLGIVLIAAPFALYRAYWRYKRRLVAFNPPEENESAPAPEQLGYRDAPVTTREERPAKAMRAFPVAIDLLMVGALIMLILNSDHVSTDFVGRMLAGVGMLVVIGVQRMHAAWKKRHDAKLMIEWERRLEEMK